MKIFIKSVNNAKIIYDITPMRVLLSCYDTNKSKHSCSSKMANIPTILVEKVAEKSM